jgi:mRNA interferase RelE/StbE
MKSRLTSVALDSYDSAPRPIQKAFEKQLKLLVENPHHPSLRVKKYNSAEDKWQARVNRNWRFYFKIDGDTFIIQDIIPHPK